ncbi:MAG: sigma-70 family RNA polymerase sigma factor [Clostridiales bacterium]|nr:sigma-70 family RNA polymerase sigma factor [Clostridiales bacterium]
MTEQELHQLLTEYGGIVRTICRSILPGQPEDAEEAEADTFFKLWRRPRLPKDSAHLRAYVIRTARSCAIDKYRRSVKQPSSFSLDEREDAAFSAELDSALETRELMELIMTLPPPDGELFLRRYVYGESSALLSGHFHMPENTIRTRLHRTKEKLQTLLRKEYFI